MSEEYYVKIVLGKWFDPHIKKVVEIYALTHEMTQEPNMLYCVYLLSA